jgi:hypothetical protein
VGGGAAASKSSGGGGGGGNNAAGGAQGALVEWVGVINDRMRLMDSGEAAWTAFLSALHDKGLQLDASLEEALKSVVWDFPTSSPSPLEVASVDSLAFSSLCFGENSDAKAAASKVKLLLFYDQHMTEFLTNLMLLLNDYCLKAHSRAPALSGKVEGLRRARSLRLRRADSSRVGGR